MDRGQQAQPFARSLSRSLDLPGCPVGLCQGQQNSRLPAIGESRFTLGAGNGELWIAEVSGLNVEEIANQHVEDEDGVGVLFCLILEGGEALGCKSGGVVLDSQLAFRGREAELNVGQIGLAVVVGRGQFEALEEDGPGLPKRGDRG